jgi:tRNA threonylcarbamoyladenosine biosynthesis protein TsaE
MSPAGLYETISPAETAAVGEALGRALSAGACITLTGPLGAGKTQFVRGLALGLGCEADMVSSPTYVLTQHYPGPVDLFHLDVYRLGDPVEEFLGLGCEEMLEQGVVAIEWAERAEPALPKHRWAVRFEITGETTRRITIQAPDE